MAICIHNKHGHDYLLRENPLQSNSDHIMRELPLSGIKGDGFGASLLDVAFQVVLEIAADTCAQ